MNQKIVGIIPLIAAMMFVAVFAVGDNQVAAASQTVTVSVNKNIAITVPDVSMTGDDGTTIESDPYGVTNVGNVQVNIWVASNQAAFTSGTTSDTIPIASSAYKIKNQAGSYVDLTQTLQKITTTKLNTKNHGNNVLSTSQQLVIPAGTEAATYTNTITYSAMET